MSDLVPLLIVILLLVLILSVVLFVAWVQPVKVLVASAARNCARAGVETLAQGRGLDQALVTAVETAGSADTTGELGVNPRGLAVRAYTEDVWGRGRVLVCETGYDVAVGGLPLLGLFYSDDTVPIRSRVSLTIEPYKSRWEAGQ